MAGQHYLSLQGLWPLGNGTLLSRVRIAHGRGIFICLAAMTKFLSSLNSRDFLPDTPWELEHVSSVPGWPGSGKGSISSLPTLQTWKVHHAIASSYGAVWPISGFTQGFNWHHVTMHAGPHACESSDMHGLFCNPFIGSVPVVHPGPETAALTAQLQASGATVTANKTVLHTLPLSRSKDALAQPCWLPRSHICLHTCNYHLASTQNDDTTLSLAKMWQTENIVKLFLTVYESIEVKSTRTPWGSWRCSRHALLTTAVSPSLLQEVCPSWVYQRVSRERQSHSASHKGAKHVTGIALAARTSIPDTVS